jgi:hypothetical protein
MRRGMWIGVLLLVIVVAIGVGIGAYNAGLENGIERAGEGVEVVRVFDRGYGFPFGFFLFPLFFIGLFLLIRGAFWRRRWEGGPGGWGPGPWRGGHEMYEEWHRRQHQQASGDHPSAGGEPSTV